MAVPVPFDEVDTPATRVPDDFGTGGGWKGDPDFVFEPTFDFVVRTVCGDTDPSPNPDADPSAGMLPPAPGLLDWALRLLLLLVLLVLLILALLGERFGVLNVCVTEGVLVLVLELELVEGGKTTVGLGVVFVFGVGL